MLNRLDKSNVWAGSYSVVFLIRRSLFVLITFVWNSFPCNQVQIVLLTTLFHLCYLAHARIHETRSLRQIEMLNECIYVCFCYHFFFFVDPVWSKCFNEKAGHSAIASICLILGINTVLILSLNVRALYHKLRLRKLRKLAEK